LGLGLGLALPSTLIRSAAAAADASCDTAMKKLRIVILVPRVWHGATFSSQYASA
jgi:hypothetical protein